MLSIKKDIVEHGLTTLFQEASIGLEKEGQRVDKEGRIVTSPHPQKLGNRSYHPYIQTDFAESQLELITPPGQNSQESMDWLTAIHEVAIRSLDNDERIWPMSMPPALDMPESEIKIAALDTPEDVFYREYLAKWYGQKKQMISGIHYNIEIEEELVKALFDIKKSKLNYKDFKTEFYLKLARNFLRYQWIIIYLYAMSAEVDPSYFDSPVNVHEAPEGPIRSLRSSHYGYVNLKPLNISFESMEAYTNDLEAAVERGDLILEKEFYNNVRLRGGKQAREVLENGISYLEFRIFDINPFDPYGISKEDVDFIHYFILALLWLDEDQNQAGIQKGYELLEIVSMEDPCEETYAKEEGIAFLEVMGDMLDTIQAPETVKQTLKAKLAMFENPELTYGAKVLEASREAGGYLKLGRNLANQYHDLAFKEAYALKGFTDMELSTQCVLFDAIQRGVKIELLDRQDNFLRLSYDGQSELVKNGNITNIDKIATYFAIENKLVTKKLLSEQGVATPKSREFTNLATALAYYELVKDKGFVIKPLSTNMGIGISIFENSPNFEIYSKAIEEAFKYDQTVMVEDFVKGPEYRFFVINGETKAVLERVPANVLGDGQHSIHELVTLKNNHPLRGENHRSPLEKINLGNLEAISLSQQGLDFDSIPEEGHRVWLRDNSNISTGGDSIDRTDQVHESYKEIAGKIGEILDVSITGIDLIIPDFNRPSSKDQPGYFLIEANFNPMMMMHIYPAEGKSRRLSMDVLELLFPSLEKRGS